ncbi:MAG: peptidoglycan bridge formation glycyltransferase FemA/FemB family protein [Chitinispirillaceae bacterium]|nr:peptidoglycan bridge formation glycyltransferase FemA/FemB family protein [Chitinispirillaceae bacterium]
MSRKLKASPIKIAWNADLPIYASESFLKTVSNEYGWLGGIGESGKEVCVLPYAVISKAIFRLVRFTTETIWLNEEAGIEEEREFLNSVVDYFTTINADLIIPPTFTSLFRTYPEGAIAVPYGSYIVELSQSEETLWKNLHQKHRNVIRNALSKGVVVREGMEYLDTAYCLVRDSFRRSAKGFVPVLRQLIRNDAASFRNQQLGIRDNVKVFAADFNGIIQSCAVIHYSNHTAYYMHGGSIDRPQTGSNNLLQWESMRYFHGNGTRFYNFVGARINPKPGSKQEGIKNYKKRFGGRFTQGYMWKYPIRRLKYALYTMAAQMRSGGDVVDQERKLYQA